jgi:hypothetical protein
MKPFSPLLILLLPIYIFAQPLPGKTPGDGWKTFDQPTYSISYPATWELNESKQMGSSFMLFSPIESAEDRFRENVNLLIQDISVHHLDLDQYTKISVEQIKSMITDAEMIEMQHVTTKTPNFYKLVYTGKQGTYLLKFIQYYFVIENQAYVLSFSATQNSYDKFKEIGESILNSFRIKK